MALRQATLQPVQQARRVIQAARGILLGVARAVRIFTADVSHGLLEVSHNALALLGLLLAAVALFAASRADLRRDAETWALGWLQARQEAREPVVAAEFVEPDAVARATASDPRDLSRQQAAVAQWLARRYRVAPEPVSRLVQEAWSVGQKSGLDPTLILAIMAVESSFNPFAQSAVGAQGLMQVMTKVHNEKYEAFGGNHAAFDPVTNLRVGVQVLKECISRAGSLEAGLRFYVGAGNQPEDAGYAGRVLSEQNALRQVASGRPAVMRQPSATAAAPVPRPEAPAAAATEPAGHAPATEKIALLR